VIAPGRGSGFADIFEANAFQNGLLAIELDQDDWQAIADAARMQPGHAEATIDLRAQTVALENHGGSSAGSAPARFSFVIPESHRERLLRGQDAISLTLHHESAISRFEKHLPAWITPMAGG
jgi:3-isopropylmalate/(R)-2-methylmalate dehydratase small subunit